jgi:transketolase
MKIDTSVLEKKSAWVRKQVLERIACAKKGHIGGALSCADILVSLFYGNVLHYKAGDPKWPGRDRFIMSKGHSAIALYAILADLGFFPAGELDKFCKNGTMLGGHPDAGIPGIEANTGSLGQGLGIAAGIALAAKMDKKQFLTFVLLGDGECLEGSVWEAAMFAGQHKLNNLIAIVDYNRQCATDFLKDSLDLEPFTGKWESFNWQVKRVNGHSFKELAGGFCGLRGNKKPLVIVADTVKGKGVSFMEKNLSWHHGIPAAGDLAAARKELVI